MKLCCYVFSLSIAMILTSSKAVCQVRIDQTLGEESSIVTKSRQPNRELIKGGARRGENLFHSFEEFNIGSGKEVFFFNPSQVDNIFSRVTGTKSTTISGKLGVKGDSSLYLMNPNGIIFSGNAQLDINGSFLATTANNIVFQDGSAFSSIKPSPPALLTVNVPVGLNLGNNSRPIIVRDTPFTLSETPFVGLFPTPTIIDDTQTGLRVSPGHTLGIVAPIVNLKSALINSSGSDIEIVGADEGFVSIALNDRGFSLDVNKNTALGRINIEDLSAIDTSGPFASNINLKSRELTLRNGSFISTTSTGNSNSAINIFAKESILVSGFDAEQANQDTNQIFSTNSVIWSNTNFGPGPKVEWH